MNKSHKVFYKIYSESKAKMMVRFVPLDRIDVLIMTDYMEPVIEEVKEILSKTHENKKINIKGVSVVQDDKLEDRRKHYNKNYREIDLDEHGIWY